MRNTLLIAGLAALLASGPIQAEDLKLEPINVGTPARIEVFPTAIKIAEFRRGLSGLATIGSTAPFVGLFGTVFGIINAFVGMGESASAGISAVAGGIAEALVTTAVGLAVAVPAVIA